MLSQLSGERVERPIAAARVALSASALLAIWLDPAEPARFVGPTYSLHAIYVGYSILVAVVMFRRLQPGRLPLVTHVADIGASSVFQYLTQGPSSPFFVYFVFALFSAALRWGWRGTVRTAAVVIVAYVLIAAWMTYTLGSTEFELSRFIVRVIYLAVVAMLLVYLGQHEVQLREDIRKLARWPAASGDRASMIGEDLLEHAAAIIGASEILVVWDAGDEPWVYLTTWSRRAFSTRQCAPDEFEPPVPVEIGGAAFLYDRGTMAGSKALISTAGSTAPWDGVPLHAKLLALVQQPRLGSAPFRTDHVSGRAFFGGVSGSTAELLPLLEIVARELGASIDQAHSHERSRRIAVAEDRIRLARDLHDGVLQSLTGIRLELQQMSSEPAADGVRRDRLRVIERALAMEQRELRTFIDGLRLPASGAGPGTLAGRLLGLRQKIALEWKTPVEITVEGLDGGVPPAVEHAVPLMVHEAIVNALKHGQPSRVSVHVSSDRHRLHIVVTDDGSGFPIAGRFELDALVQTKFGPASLRERVTSLGGQLAIESTDRGARIEMSVPLILTHA